MTIPSTKINGIHRVMAVQEPGFQPQTGAPIRKDYPSNPELIEPHLQD
jgi:hypothetical protein